MKKTSLFALLLLLNVFAFAQEEAFFIGINKVTFTESKATLTSFMIFNTDKDAYASSLTALLGQPAQNSAGVLLWENVPVDGLGKVPKVKLLDGLMTHDTQSKTSCFIPFKDAEDKQKKLAGLQDNQERQMQIEFIDNKGNCMIHTSAQEEASKKFLTGIVKKG